MYRKILVAYDGSDGATAALAEAAEIARSGGGSLTVAQCTGGFESAPQTLELSAPDPEEERRALAALREATAGLDGEPELRVVEGHPPRALLGVAEEIGADLVVTGSRGRAVMPQAVLGRVSSGLVSNAPCDVLVVQPRPR
jgi:nucleotide-binding universal stress UspA family protein